MSAISIDNALFTKSQQKVLGLLYGKPDKSFYTNEVVSESLAYADLMNVLTEAEEIIGRTINPSIYTIEQIKKKINQKNAFLTRLMEQPKLWVKGNEDDIKAFRNYTTIV